ncbi:MAG TPA: DUF6785 family protein [Planctomycetota bacterium]|nr:DUF6785 family protein [Planctomycetota bacterium]
MSEPSPTPTTPRPRAFTVRAVVIGVLLALPLAWLTPWNDWYLDNAYLFNNFLPPLATTVLLLLAAVVNPLLGPRRRLARGELVVIAALLLAVGGVVSSGFARYWSGVVAGPARMLARTNHDALKLPLDEARAEAALARMRAHAERDAARLDADGNGRLDADEAWGSAERIAAADRDGDGTLTREEYVLARLAGDDAAQATWTWALPGDLFLGLPPAGPSDANDAEYQHVVDGYLDGARGVSAAGARIGHRARVTWRAADGVLHERELALSGDEREHHPAAGALDLDAPLGAALRGHRAGVVVATPLGPVEILAVEPPGVPWYAWAAPALAWAPLVIGLCLASIAAAFLVRRQWLEHERLPYPVAAATFSLIDDPQPGRRLPPVVGDRGFGVALAIAAAVVTWRGLAAMDVVPFTIALEVRLPLDGQPWEKMYEWWMQVNPHLFLGMLAMAFLIPLDLSFSLWFFFVATNLIVMALRTGGHEISFHHVRHVGFGAFAMIAPLVLWLGRRWYLAVAAAAFGRRTDAAARAAAPWLWAMIGGLATMAAWLVAHGAPVVEAIGMVLMYVGFLLVIARILAEAGVPFLQMPENINELLYTTIGFGLPVAALLPLALIGMCLLDAREAVLPYAVDASYLAERGAVPPRRLAATMLVVALAGAAIACAAVVWFAYTGSGHSDTFTPYQYELDKIANGDAAGGVASTARRAEDFWCYGLGAGVTAACAVARTLLSWWPFHPLALGVALSYPGAHGWASFLVAWAAKALIMRYGGVGLYRRLVPVAIGLAAGEALAVCGFAVAKIVIQGIHGVPIATYVNALPS